MGRSLGLILVTLLVTGVSVGTWRWWREERLSRNHAFASRARILLAVAQSKYIQSKSTPGGEPVIWTQDVAGLYQFGLIDRSLAEADDRPVQPLAPTPIPANGYYVRFLPMNGSKGFAYCVHPAEPGVTGNFIYIVGETHTIRRCPVGVRPVPTAWPSDDELRQYWTNDCGG